MPGVSIMADYKADPGRRNEESLSVEAPSLAAVGAEVVSKYRSEDPDGVRAVGFLGLAAGLCAACGMIRVDLDLDLAPSLVVRAELWLPSTPSIKSSISNTLVIIVGNLHTHNWRAIRILI